MYDLKGHAMSVNANLGKASDAVGGLVKDGVNVP